MLPSRFRYRLVLQQHSDKCLAKKVQSKNVMPDLDVEEYKAKLKTLSDAITINVQRIDAKVKEPTSIASLEDIDTLLLDIGTIIDKSVIKV